MAERIVFTGATLKQFSRSGKGASATFAASLSAAVVRAMNWEEIPECFTSVKLDGQLVATRMELAPKQSELAKHAIELDAHQVSGFEAIRLEIEGKKGKGFRTELRFTVKSTDNAACRKLEQYMLTIGTEGKGSLTVNYTKQEALALDDVHATEEQRQAALEIN